MLLDYNPRTLAYFLRVNRGEHDIRVLMRDHGLDLSLPASTAQEAVLLSHNPYAAAAFAGYATPRARAEMGHMLSEIEASWAPTSNAHIKVPYDKELWPFQKADIEYALRRPHTLVGDQPGLGKTPIAIALANEIGAKRVLCIVPASIRLQWVARIREWTTMRWPYVIHPITHSRHGVNPNAQWTVVSYELARTEAIGRALAKLDYDLLIIDEAHYLKTVDATRTRAVFGGGTKLTFEPLASKAKMVLALTGTPLPNRPREAYTLARNLCWDSIDWMSEDAFVTRFNPAIRGERIDPVTGQVKVYTDERTGRHAELQARLRSHFMTRHLKRDVMPQLKLPVYDVVTLEETAAVKEALNAESLLHIDPENYDEHIDLFGGEIATIRRMMGEALAPQIADYVDMLIDGGEEKLVVFAWHLSVMTELERRWQKHGVLRVDGGTSAVKKDRLVKKFQSDPRCKIILGNLLSLGTGTDGLQHVCTHALIAEPDWVPGNNIQAFDRLDRGGQTRQVQGDIFVAPGSILEKILGSALRKLQVTDKALDRRIK
ncbi:MAG: DEAD/DEAH box helicase [Reyranella sp.]|uniref:DEAD/DEAH box helicase n=1 Tax=Reyranella sp. TaxID=1929291 RepID=UPI003D135F2B